MFDKKKILAIIPARGGSKGIPRKNIRNLGGKPLISWTIEAAKKSKYIDRLILSSEDEEIIAVAKKYGCEVPFIRPAELAMDDTPGTAPVLHVIQILKEHFDYLVLLQPTSPFRTAEDIDGAIQHCIGNKEDACVSVVESEKHPAWMFFLTERKKLAPVLDQKTLVTHRQQLAPVYVLNGAIYVVNVRVFLQEEIFLLPNRTISYQMPKERSIDIDSEFDFKQCEWIAKELEKGNVF